jgi:hypothetical protein
MKIETPAKDGTEFGAAHIKLFDALRRAQYQAGDVARRLVGIDTDERLDYLINQVMDSAHEILDLAHEFKQATLKHHA